MVIVQVLKWSEKGREMKKLFREIDLVCVITLAFILAGSVPAFAVLKDSYFTPPRAPFIVEPGEKVKILTFESWSVDKVNSAMQSARKADAEVVLVVRLSGRITVRSNPLKPVSRCCIIFETGASLSASSRAKAPALVSISNSEYVSLTGAGLDRTVLSGRRAIRNGIVVSNSARINIDHLHIRNCTGSGIDYTGRGAEVFAEAGSVSRCRVENCSDGLKVADSTQFVVVDSQFLNNAKSAITTESHGQTLLNNYCRGNGSGIIFGGRHCIVTRNTVLHSKEVGIQANNSADYCLLTYNHLDNNGTAFEIAGKNNKVYYNEMGRNNKQFEVEGENNCVVGHRNITFEDVSLKGRNYYFNPPTIAYNHKDKVIVPGMGRRDITVNGGKSMADADRVNLDKVQQAIDQARRENPNDVIVAHLKGHFVADKGMTGLEIPEATCLLLYYTSIKAEGEIIDCMNYPKDDWETRRNTKLIFIDKSLVSISGGELYCNFKPYHGIWARGGNIAVIDSVIVKDSGFNGITTVKRSSPLFIRGCTVVASTNRGLWVHVCSNVHMIDNVFSGNYADGIDFDAGAHRSNSLFNVCTGNRRDGIFYEISVNHSASVGNVLNWNRARGLHRGMGKESTVICNDLSNNEGTGLMIRGNQKGESSSGFMLFNNIVKDNGAYGVHVAHRPGTVKDCYISQNVIYNNREEYGNRETQYPVYNFTAP